MKSTFLKNASGSIIGTVLMLAASNASANIPPLSSFAESPAWKQGQEFILVFNSGDARQMKRFLKQHLSDQAITEQGVDRRVVELIRIRRKYGTVEAVEFSGMSHAAVVNVRSRGGIRDADIILVVDGKNPSRLDQLRLVEIPLDEAAVFGASK